MSEFVRCGILSQMSSNAADLSMLRYKCNVSYEIANSIAQDLNIDLAKYLEAGTRR